MNEIKKTRQDMKEDFNKYIEILTKKSNWNSENGKLNKLNKKSAATLFSRLDQIGERMSGLEDKVDVLEHAHKDWKTKTKI
jgi:hypothetical protein